MGGSRIFLLLLDLLEEALEVLRLLLEELDLLGALFAVILLLLLDDGLDGFFLSLQLDHSLFLLLLVLLKLNLFLLKLGATMLRLKLLPHSEGNRAAHNGKFEKCKEV